MSKTTMTALCSATVLSLGLGLGAQAMAGCIENASGHEVWVWFAPDGQGESEIIAPGESLCHEDYAGPVQVSVRDDNRQTSYGSVEVEAGGNVLVGEDSVVTMNAAGEIVEENNTLGSNLGD